MNLDLFSIALICSVVFITLSIAVYFQRLQNKANDAIWWWFTGSLMMSLGFSMLLFVRIPAIRLLAALGSPLIVLGAILLYVGVIDFYSEPKKNKQLIMIYFTFICVYIGFIIKHDISIRTVAISTTMCIISLMTSHTLFSKKAPELSISSNFTAAVFFLYGFFHATRVFYTLISPKITDISKLDEVAIQVVIFIVTIICGILWTFGFVLMINQKLNTHIQKEKSNLRTIFNSSVDANLIIRKSDHIIIDVNDAFMEMMGYSHHDVIGKPIDSVCMVDESSKIQSQMKEPCLAVTSEPVEIKFKRTDGQLFWATAFSKEIMMDDSLHLLCVLSDITDRKRAEDAIRESRELYLSILEASPDDITISDINGRILIVSPAGKRMFGFDSDYDVMTENHNIKDFIIPVDRERAMMKIKSLLQGLNPGPSEYTAQRKDGATFSIESNIGAITDPDGKPTKLVFAIRDITERKRSEQQISDLIIQLEKEKQAAQVNSITDGLTGLLNRRCFDEYLRHEFAHLKRSGLPVSIIMLDVDHFKRYNDHYGHVAGDQCLRDISNALRLVVSREQDILVRYGGEEFIAILPETTESGAVNVAEKILNAVMALDIPHATSGASTNVTVSIGISTALPTHMINPEKFVQMADEAMYRAKNEGRNRYCVYSAINE